MKVCRDDFAAFNCQCGNTSTRINLPWTNRISWARINAPSTGAAWIILGGRRWGDLKRREHFAKQQPRSNALFNEQRVLSNTAESSSFGVGTLHNGR
jgi:hypothetical protein